MLDAYTTRWQAGAVLVNHDEEKDGLAEEVRKATLSLRDLQSAVDEWKASHTAGSPMLRRSLTRLFDTFGMTVPETTLAGSLKTSGVYMTTWRCGSRCCA